MHFKRGVWNCVIGMSGIRGMFLGFERIQGVAKGGFAPYPAPRHRDGRRVERRPGHEVGGGPSMWTQEVQLANELAQISNGRIRGCHG